MDTSREALDERTFVTLARTSDDMDRALAQLRAAALCSGGLCLVQLLLADGSLHIIACTLAAPVASAASQPAAATVAGALFRTTVFVDGLGAHASAPDQAGHEVTPSEIECAIEAALEAYHHPEALQHNPLVCILALDHFRQPRDNPSIAGGLALRRAIDAAMHTIERRPVKRAGRMAHYFRMRYVEGSTQTEAAGSLDRSERTANRIKHDLIEHLAHALRALSGQQSLGSVR